MRTKEEILESFYPNGSEGLKTDMLQAIAEVLIDIRDLLSTK